MNLIKNTIILLITLSITACQSASNNTAQILSTAEITTPAAGDESIWNELLSKHVSTDGVVDYTALKTEEAKLDKYLNWLNYTKMTGFSSDKSKAHWINAYNAYTVKLILKNLPTESIKDISENWKGPWDIPFCDVAGKTYTLTQIEHEILRKDYNDPRIHAGINCASISCPQLPNKAMTETNVNSLLETAMKNFINDPKRNDIISGDEVEISKIFKWFKEDFVKEGSLIDYLNKYSNTVLDKDASVSYKSYNWNLNGK